MFKNRKPVSFVIAAISLIALLSLTSIAAANASGSSFFETIYEFFGGESAATQNSAQPQATPQTKKN